MAQDTLELTCERMGYGPDAIAHRDDGKTVFVLGGAPGDVVRCEVTGTGSSFDRARVVEVVSAGDARRAAACTYAGVCGGCPWAHLTRAAQLDAKRGAVIDALARIGKMGREAAEGLVGACEAPSDEWGYRNKVELAFVREGGRVSLGMHGAGEGSPIKVKQCMLLEKRFAGSVKSVSGALSYLAGSRAEIDLERVGIRASVRTKELEVALWDSPGPFPRAQASKIIGDATRATSVVRVLEKGPAKARRVSSVERLSGAGCWSELVGDHKMLLSAPSFFQVNTRGAERLIELVMEGLEVREDDVTMDLYCGAGTFTLPLADRCDWVEAVEAYAPAVRDLRRNLERAGIDNVSAQGGDAGREFPDIDADVIVVDPPRAGLAADVVEQLSASGARAIAYVSCDPATLARDLERFAEAGSYRPTRVTPVDLFPQTFHVESVAILKSV